MGQICILCKNIENKIIFQEFGIDILKCKNCGHVFSSYKTEQDYDGYFSDESVESEKQFWWDDAHREMYYDFCRRFISGKSGRLLDVGCGLGYFVKKMSDFQQWEVYGYEISRQAAEYAQKKLGLRNIFHGKIEDSNFVRMDSFGEKKSFDIITLWDVIEHIPDPDPLFSYLVTLLKDNGMLFIHTPNIKIQLAKAKLKKMLKGMKSDIHYLEAKDHINIYSMNTIRKVLYRNGFGKVKFIHLKPIQSVSGSENRCLIFLKNLWYYVSVILFIVSFGCLNFDNLFVSAKK